MIDPNRKPIPIDPCPALQDGGNHDFHPVYEDTASETDGRSEARFEATLKECTQCHLIRPINAVPDPI